MANNITVEVTPEQFKNEKDLNKKLDFMYSAIVVQTKHCSLTCDDNDRKFAKLFKRRKIDTATAMGSASVFGFLGGFIRGFFGK